VDYRFRRGSTKIAFEGSQLMPRLSGEATVKSGRGVTEISARFTAWSRPDSSAPST
jgi:hypothetical protein